jgi:hypothetical protein
MNRDTAHSLYTTNDRGVNEAALQEIPHIILFLKIHDLFINSPQLTRRRWRSAIETALYHRMWIQQPPQRMHVEAQPASREVAVSRSERIYPCATLNSLSEIIRSPSMGAPSRRCKPSYFSPTISRRIFLRYSCSCLPPFPRWYGLWISPKAFSAFSHSLL